MLRAIVVVLIMSWSGTVYGYHPLITDDTGTQGKGGFQLEIQSEYGYDKETAKGVTTRETGGEFIAVLSYGMTENLDLMLSLPYQWFRVKENGMLTEKQQGISDASLELKWRFFEKEGLSLALKPVISFPTGDEDKGLGTGRSTYGMFLIATRAAEPWDFNLNAGYTRNENRADERRNKWHASLSAALEVLKDLKVAANIGVESNPDKTSNTHPAFLLGGIIYSVDEDLDIDLGLKGGLNRTETDTAILAGITWRF